MDGGQANAPVCTLLFTVCVIGQTKGSNGRRKEEKKRRSGAERENVRRQLSIIQEGKSAVRSQELL